MKSEKELKRGKRREERERERERERGGVFQQLEERQRV